MDLFGYADLHCHPMAHLGFGGNVYGRALFWGEPTGPLEQALPCCKMAHDPWDVGEEGFLPTVMEHLQTGFNGFRHFDGWPRATTLIHQQMYIDWLERAYRAGLRLMVASAVNNEMLADLYHENDKRLRLNSDARAIEAQVDGMRALADQTEWMEVVYSAARAREVIAEGRLAVVLGIECDSVAGEPMRRDGQLNPDDSDAVVDKWWKLGIRVINPIHLADSALGGAGIYMDRFNCSNNYLIAKWADHLSKPWYFEVEAASGDAADVEFLLGTSFAEIPSRDAYDILSRGDLFPCYVGRLPGARGHVNKRGLTEAGGAFLRAMMRRGMLIDVEHMGAHSFDDTVTLARDEDGYPLLSSHTPLRALAVRRPVPELPYFREGCASENMRSDKQLRELKELKSVIGIFGHLGHLDDIRYDTSQSWARGYRHVLEQIGFTSAALGSDMNGLPQQPGPRFKEKWFSNSIAPVNPKDSTRAIRYGTDNIPFADKIKTFTGMLQRQQIGRRRCDFNLEGLSNYGLLPDFTIDIALQLGEEALAPFYRSAEAFVNMWTLCEEKA